MAYTLMENVDTIALRNMMLGPDAEDRKRPEQAIMEARKRVDGVMDRMDAVPAWCAKCAPAPT
jgi:hypothetical protein